jgi:hypothetical protein
MTKQKLIFLDTETIGLTGPCMLIQYARGIEGAVETIQPRFEPWISDRFIEELDDPNVTILAYNAPFDLAVLYRTYTHTLTNRLKCKVIDLQNHAKLKHPLGKFTFQREGERAIAALKKIPTDIAQDLSDYVVDSLQRSLPKEVRVKGSIHKCSIYTKAAESDDSVELEEEVEEKYEDKDFKNLSFSVQANFKLKTLMRYYGHKTQELGDVWPVPAKKSELLHNPFLQPVHEDLIKECTEILSGRDPRSKNFWKYAKDDVVYLQQLYKHLKYPEPDYNDDMSHIVGFTYYYGFDLDHKILNGMKDDCEPKLKACDNLPFNPDSSVQKLAHFQARHPKLKLPNCDKAILEKLANKGDEDAKILVKHGTIKQWYDQCIKLLETSDGKGHPNFRVIGTATQRMAGSGGFNWQGIGKKSPVRKAVLAKCGGDFSGLEIGLMAIIYDDKQMQQDLLEGKDIHLATAIDIHPRLKGKYTYEEAFKIREAKSPAKDYELIESCRTETKAVVFGSAYGAEPPKIAETLGISLLLAEELLTGFYERYSGIRDFKGSLEAEFATGDTDTWDIDSVGEMRRTIIDKLGYERRWDFEADTADFFWRLSKTGDPAFKAIFLGHEGKKLTRREEKGPQTYQRATMSALLGAALTIQKSVARTATNSVVQSTGAQLTKRLMSRLWNVFGVPMLNVHDEVIVGHHKNSDYEKINKVVQDWITDWQKMFPYLGMKFSKLNNWSER